MLARSAIRARRQNSPRPAWKVADAFRQWLRGRPCARVAKGECRGPMVAAHVDHGGSKGMGTKTADRDCIPLCDGCHRHQHAIGWRSFESGLPGGDAVKLAAEYWRAWPGRAAWERSL